MRFIIFCILWIVFFSISYFIGSNPDWHLSFEYIFTISIIGSWCLAMFIVLFGKNIKMPEFTHEIHGFLMARVTKSGRMLGMIVFNDDNLCFMKKAENEIHYPDVTIKYKNIQSAGYGNNEENMYVKTPSNTYYFLGDTEAVSNVLNNIKIVTHN